MKRFVEGEGRRQGVLLPEFLDDYVSEENPVRVIDAFVEALDLGALGFEGVAPESTGRPAYHPGVLLKIYVYGYINQIASSRRLERESQRNVELMWLTGRLAPDFKTIADFRKDNGAAIRASCRRFIDGEEPDSGRSRPKMMTAQKTGENFCCFGVRSSKRRLPAARLWWSHSERTDP
jgi:transposase